MDLDTGLGSAVWLITDQTSITAVPRQVRYRTPPHTTITSPLG
ncbi:MAG: hypothetical protein QOH60_3775 [Mycobacterium sp.]|jgi:hypothetical protein|nr:hypothetical protein [Mycobacterium sp.]